MKMISLGENFGRRLERAMRQQFARPIEQISFARTEFGRALVFAHRLQWIAQLLVDLSKLVMKVRLLVTSRGIADVLAANLVSRNIALANLVFAK